MLQEFLNVYFFHWAPEKAIWISGHALSWDARCSGIYGGFGVGLASQFATAGRLRPVLPSWGRLGVTFLLLPLLLDVGTIMAGWRFPSNDVRFLTGLLFGCGSSLLVYPDVRLLGVRRKVDRPTLLTWRWLTLVSLLVCGAYFLKKWDHIVAFVVLESFGVLGASGLLLCLGVGGARAFRHYQERGRCSLTCCGL